jgi:hypothetical protein
MGEDEPGQEPEQEADGGRIGRPEGERDEDAGQGSGRQAATMSAMPATRRRSAAKRQAEGRGISARAPIRASAAWPRPLATTSPATSTAEARK